MKNLSSHRFAGDSDLTKVANGTLRLGAAGTSPFPAPVLSSGPAIMKVQQALIDLGYQMPQFGADGNFADETGTAVIQFKKDWHLVPRDPVVGPKTIDALDREMIAFERPEPVPPPPPPPPPPPDSFGRTVAGFARVPGALAVTAQLATGAGSPWTHLDRATVTAGIIDRVNNPDGAQQGATGLCTEAAFINVWAQDAPEAYAAFAAALYNHGVANIAPNQHGGGQRIQASNTLLTADYAAIAAKMRAKGPWVPSQADWMVMTAIRDGTNRIYPFTGEPDTWMNGRGVGAANFVDLDGWLRNAGAWSFAVNEANPLLTASLDQAKQLDPARSRCLLNIDATMLQKNNKGRHSVVLRSPITETNDGFVTLKVWSWTFLWPVRMTKAEFEATYFGANVVYL